MHTLKTKLLIICCLCACAVQARQQDTTSVKVLFYLDKYYLTDSARHILDLFLDKYRNTDSLILDGYCDYRANLAYNDRLAENRIVSVANYLHAKGFNQTAVLLHQPHGKRITLDTRQNETGYAQNRAVVITIKHMKTAALLPREKFETADTVKPAPPATAPVPVICDTLYINDNVRNKAEEEILTARLMGYIDEGKPCRSIVVTTVYFEEGRHVFVKSSLPVLAAVAKAIKAYPTATFELQGHVCCTDVQAVDALDFDTKKFDLSVERVQAVHDYLIKAGVGESQVAAMHGYGSRHRLGLSEKTTAERNRNRRVQFVLLTK